MDIEELKSELISIYRECSNNKPNSKIKKEAKEIYNKYKDLDPVLNKDVAFALRSLVDIAFNTGIKISKDKCKRILNSLKNDNS